MTWHDKTPEDILDEISEMLLDGSTLMNDRTGLLMPPHKHDTLMRAAYPRWWPLQKAAQAGADMAYRRIIAQK